MLSRNKTQILPMNDCFGSSVLRRGGVAMLENGANRSKPRAQADAIEARKKKSRMWPHGFHDGASKSPA